jgi:hypothetical protein
VRKISVGLPGWISKAEAQGEVIRDLRARALLKLEFYRSKMRPFEIKHATTFPRFQKKVEKSGREDFAAWDELTEWEAYYRAYQEWKKRHAELQKWSGI